MKKLLLYSVTILLTLSLTLVTSISKAGKGPVTVDINTNFKTIKEALNATKTALLKQKFLTTSGMQESSFVATRHVSVNSDTYLADVTAELVDAKVKITITFSRAGTSGLNLNKIANEIKEELERGTSSNGSIQQSNNSSQKNSSNENPTKRNNNVSKNSITMYPDFFDAKSTEKLDNNRNITLEKFENSEDYDMDFEIAIKANGYKLENGNANQDNYILKYFVGVIDKPGPDPKCVQIEIMDNKTKKVICKYSEKIGAFKKSREIADEVIDNFFKNINEPAQARTNNAVIEDLPKVVEKENEVEDTNEEQTGKPCDGFANISNNSENDISLLLFTADYKLNPSTKVVDEITIRIGKTKKIKVKPNTKYFYKAYKASNDSETQDYEGSFKVDGCNGFIDEEIK